jgi:hypothetical protein
MSGVAQAAIEAAEDLMGELVLPPQESQGKTFYAAAPPPKDEEEAEPAPVEKKKKKTRSWSTLANTSGPKYAGRGKDEEEMEAFEVSNVETGAPREPAKQELEKPPEKPKELEKPHLKVHPELGAGVDLVATCWGMRVDGIEAEPGQPHLTEGCTIISIGGVNLIGLPDEDAVAEAFGAGFKPDAPVQVDPVSYETVALPSQAATWPPSFTNDLDGWSGKFALEYEITRMGLELRGPSVAMEPAKVEVLELFDYYMKGQSAQQQKQHQMRIDHAALQEAARRAEERQRREAEEAAMWQYAIQQMYEQQLAMQQAYMMQQAAMAQSYHQQQQFYSPAPVQQMAPPVAQPMVPQQPPQQMYQQPPPMQQQPPQLPEWVSAYTPQGQPYFYNERTGEQALTLPQGVRWRDGSQQQMGMQMGMQYGYGAPQQQQQWQQPYGQQYGGQQWGNQWGGQQWGNQW